MTEHVLERRVSDDVVGESESNVPKIGQQFDHLIEQRPAIASGAQSLNFEDESFEVLSSELSCQVEVCSVIAHESHTAIRPMISLICRNMSQLSGLL